MMLEMIYRFKNEIYYEIWGTLTAAGFCLFMPVALFLLGCVSFCHILCKELVKMVLLCVLLCNWALNIFTSTFFLFLFTRVSKRTDRTEGDDPCNLTFPFCITSDLLTWWRRAISSMKAIVSFVFLRFIDIKECKMSSMHYVFCVFLLISLKCNLLSYR